MIGQHAQVDDPQHSETSVADDFKRSVSATTARWRRDSPWRIVLLFGTIAVVGVVMLLWPGPFVYDGYTRFALRSVTAVWVTGAVALAVGTYGTLLTIRRPRT